MLTGFFSFLSERLSAICFHRCFDVGGTCSGRAEQQSAVCRQCQPGHDRQRLVHLATKKLNGYVVGRNCQARSIAMRGLA
jgi:hypothetical protein